MKVDLQLLEHLAAALDTGKTGVSGEEGIFAAILQEALDVHGMDLDRQTRMDPDGAEALPDGLEHKLLAHIHLLETGFTGNSFDSGENHAGTVSSSEAADQSPAGKAESNGEKGLPPSTVDQQALDDEAPAKSQPTDLSGAARQFTAGLPLQANQAGTPVQANPSGHVTTPSAGGDPAYLTVSTAAGLTGDGNGDILPQVQPDELGGKTRTFAAKPPVQPNPAGTPGQTNPAGYVPQQAAGGDRAVFTAHSSPGPVGDNAAGTLKEGQDAGGVKGQFYKTSPAPVNPGGFHAQPNPAGASVQPNPAGASVQPNPATSAQPAAGGDPVATSVASSPGVVADGAGEDPSKVQSAKISGAARQNPGGFSAQPNPAGPSLQPEQSGLAARPADGGDPAGFSAVSSGSAAKNGDPAPGQGSLPGTAGTPYSDHAAGADVSGGIGEETTAAKRESGQSEIPREGSLAAVNKSGPENTASQASPGGGAHQAAAENHVSRTPAGGTEQSAWLQEPQPQVNVQPAGDSQPQAGTLREAVLQQVEGRLVYLRGGSAVPAEMRLTLHPPELGEITIRVVSERGKLSATIVTESSLVKEILESSVSELRQRLNQFHIQLEQLDISTAGRHEGGEQAGRYGNGSGRGGFSAGPGGKSYSGPDENGPEQAAAAAQGTANGIEFWA